MKRQSTVSFITSRRNCVLGFAIILKTHALLFLPPVRIFKTTPLCVITLEKLLV